MLDGVQQPSVILKGNAYSYSFLPHDNHRLAVLCCNTGTKVWLVQDQKELYILECLLWKCKFVLFCISYLASSLKIRYMSQPFHGYIFASHPQSSKKLERALLLPCEKKYASDYTNPKHSSCKLEQSLYTGLELWQ